MKTKKNTHLELKLHEMNNKKLEKIHTEELGLKIPADYFSKSKIEILNKINEEKSRKAIPFYKKKQYWMVAASVLFLLGFSFYSINGFLGIKNQSVTTNKVVVLENKLTKKPSSQEVTKTIEQPKINLPEKNIASIPKEKPAKTAITPEEIKNNVLVESLFIEENQINDYVTNYMLEDI